jgi:hypothetical protein
MYWAVTIIRPDGPVLPKPAKTTREPSLTTDSNCPAASGGKRTTVPSFSIKPFVSPSGPALNALIVPRRE